MPSKSKSQQRFFGMVDAYKKGELKDASSEVKKAANGMSMSDVKDFAETKHKGLPEKVEENVIRLTESDLHSLVKEAVEKILKETDYRHEGWDEGDYINPDVRKKLDKRNRNVSKNKVLSALNQAKRLLMMISPVYAFDAASSIHTGQSTENAIAMAEDSELVQSIGDAIHNIEKAQASLGINSYRSDKFNWDDYVDKGIGNSYKDIKF